MHCVQGLQLNKLEATSEFILSTIVYSTVQRYTAYASIVVINFMYCCATSCLLVLYTCCSIRHQKVDQLVFSELQCTV